MDGHIELMNIEGDIYWYPTSFVAGLVFLQ